MTCPRPTTILATPVIPDASGVGIEQRAARTLSALAALADVELVWCRPPLLRSLDRLRHPRRRHVPLTVADRLEPLSGETLTRRACLAWPQSALLGALSTCLAYLPTRATYLNRPTASAAHFHAFRLAAAAALAPGTTARRHLDLDDLESVTARAIAHLARRSGDRAVADFYDALANRLVALERHHIGTFDRVHVGSSDDATWLAAHHPGPDIRILPNVVDVPPLSHTPRRPGPIRLLFVGALDYYPNIDALRRLIDTIAPALGSLRPNAFNLHVVGRGGPAWLLKRLRQSPDVIFHGAAPSMRPHLAAADALVAPLGAGGGTRIKLLEAFAAGIPVIATTIGAAGLAVAHDTHLTLADTDDALIAACIRLIDDPHTANDMRIRAHAFVATQHHPKVFNDAIAKP